MLIHVSVNLQLACEDLLKVNYIFLIRVSLKLHDMYHKYPAAPAQLITYIKYELAPSCLELCSQFLTIFSSSSTYGHMYICRFSNIKYVLSRTSLRVMQGDMMLFLDIA